MLAVTALRHGPLVIAWAHGAEARAAVLQGLLEHAGAPTDAVTHECPTCGSSEHGPLQASSGTVVLSLGHAGDLTAGVIARAEAAASVGIDVEALDAGRTPGTPLQDLTALFAPAAPPTLREWTIIEAAVKADGRGLRIAPSDVVIDGARAHIPGRPPIDVASVDAPAGYLISVAIDPSHSSRPARGSDR
ncbi:hypothetical protein ACI3KS_12700 [Microbacterium sp. ZW T5_45]|uniref:hypothetical protein n=1 Tax=Microbacterium sp. ZW T5_45 TaxID=3378080 RepID=UPI003851BCC0